MVATQRVVPPDRIFPPVFVVDSIHQIRPSTIISAAGPHCRVNASRRSGALVVLVAVHVSVAGLYLPPVFRSFRRRKQYRPQTIISLPVHDCCVTESASGRVSVVRFGFRAIRRCGMYLATGVLKVGPAAPDNHLVSGRTTPCGCGLCSRGRRPR